MGCMETPKEVGVLVCNTISLSCYSGTVFRSGSSCIKRYGCPEKVEMKGGDEE
jgi:hypothetical protein